MIILDTNVVSALMQPRPEERAVRWVDAQARNSLWITAMTIMEIRCGLQLLPPGRRRSALLGAFETAVRAKIEGRIAQFDTAAAECAGDVQAERQRRGMPVEVRDTMIAGIVLAARATLATRNVEHFKDLSVPVVNPWKD